MPVVLVQTTHQPKFILFAGFLLFLSVLPGPFKNLGKALIRLLPLALLLGIAFNLLCPAYRINRPEFIDFKKFCICFDLLLELISTVAKSKHSIATLLFILSS